MKLGYNELGYNEHSVITNKFLGKIGHFTTQMNPVITKPGYNEQRLAGPELFVITEFDCISIFRRSRLFFETMFVWPDRVALNLNC